MPATSAAIKNEKATPTEIETSINIHLGATTKARINIYKIVQAILTQRIIL